MIQRREPRPQERVLIASISASGEVQGRVVQLRANKCGPREVYKMGLEKTVIGANESRPGSSRAFQSRIPY